MFRVDPRNHTGLWPIKYRYIPHYFVIAVASVTVAHDTGIKDVIIALYAWNYTGNVNGKIYVTNKLTCADMVDRVSCRLKVSHKSYAGRIKIRAVLQPTLMSLMSLLDRSLAPFLQLQH